MILLKWIMLDRAVSLIKLTTSAVAELTATISNTIIVGTVNKRSLQAVMELQSINANSGPLEVNGSLSTQTIEGNIKC